MFDIPLPDDLALAPQDPHPSMDGFGAEWPYRSLSFTTPRIYYARVFHTQPHSQAETAALELGRKIAEGGYAGLIMDYRGAVIDHDKAAFSAVAQAFAASFPRTLLVAYLHDDATAPFASFMRTLLKEHGLKVARMRDFERAWTAILKELNTPAA